MVRSFITLSAAVAFTTGPVMAQSSAELAINDVRARFWSHGLIGADPNSAEPMFRVPQNGNAHALHTAGLWMGGLSPDNQLKLAAMMYEGAGSSDHYPGPLTVGGDATTTSGMMAVYDHVWSVTRAEIDLHLAYFNCLNDPNCDLNAEFPDGYTIPPSILDWPAINTAVGYDHFQAPFIDFNSNFDQYEPQAGDAPCILGDQALYFVFNDKGGAHLLSGAQPIGIEVQAMAFAFTGDDPALEQTVFVHYHIINRGTQTLTNTYLGLFNDFDLGCGDDDLVGSDPARNLVYVINGDDDDGDCSGVVGYGTQPPAFGMVVLKGPYLDPNAVDDPVVSTLPAWNGGGFDDQTIDNERFGITSSMHIYRDGDQCCTAPTSGSSNQFYNYLRGIWKDGVPFSYGGTGHSTDPDAVDCAFSFPGNSDPLGVGTAGVPQPAWSDTPSSLMDRRMLTSSGPFTLVPGMHQDLVVAYVFARASSGGALASLDALRTRVDSVTTFAHTLPLFDIPQDQFQGGCDLGLPDAVVHVNDPEIFEPFHVPASNEVTLMAPNSVSTGTIRLLDATGRVVVSQQLVPGRNAIDIAGLANGVYICDVLAGREHFTTRLVKQ